MIATVRRWFARDPRKELIDVLGDVDVPSFQPSILRILSLLRDPNSRNEDIGDAVMADPGLSVRVLRMVNSGAFGLLRKVDNVGHATALLGRGSLEELVLGLAVRQALPRNEFSDARYWRLAAERAATARAIADRVDPSRAPLCFSGGLLQDMAVPLLATARPAYGALVRNEGMGAVVAQERDRFGFDHAEVADWLCEAWGFPDTLRHAIGGHHNGADAPVPVQVVALVEASGMEEDPLVEAIQGRFGLRPDTVREALDLGRSQGADLALALR